MPRLRRASLWAAAAAVASCARAEVGLGGSAAGGLDATLGAVDKLPGFNTHIPPPGMPAVELAGAAPLLSAGPGAAPGDWGKGVCTAGVWQDGKTSALEAGTITPQVQCWRNPPCIRYSYATSGRCKAWVNDSDWPTTDPYLPSDPPGQHTMKQLLDSYWRDKTVIFVGDSITSLTYNAALCEAAKVYDLTPGVHNAAAANDPGDLHTRLAAFHRTLNELRTKDMAMGGTLWLPGPPQMPEAVGQSRTLLVSKGWHKWKQSDMEGIMAIADVIIVNYGLHYAGNVTEFEEAMPLMMKQLDEFASQPGKAALFRETGAEHRNVDENKPEGTFLPSEINPPDKTKVRGCQCQQRQPSDGPGLGPQMNKLVADLIEKHPHVGIVPFMELTAPRHDMHEAGYCAFEGLRGKKPEDPPPYCCDCTHFCYTPQLWKKFFSGVYEEMARLDAKVAR